MVKTAPHPCLSLFEGEIARFQQFARMRSTSDESVLRRNSTRYHRSWPLLIASCENGCLQEYSAALHDASHDGIGFMCDRGFPIDELIYIRLFWHDANALRIPSLVRHITPTPDGVLVGTEYALADWEACEFSLTLDQN